MISKKDSIRIKQISSSLYEISRRVKILRHLVWPDNVRFKFFRTKSEKLPKVEYLKFDSGDILNKLTSIESVFGDTPYDHWLRSKALDRNQ